MGTDQVKWWKKGTKVIRLYGISSTDIKPGDVATLAKDQDCPGNLELVEFPDAFNHDPIRFRRVKDYPDFKPKELSDLWYATHEQSFHDVLKLFKAITKRRTNEQTGTNRPSLKGNRFTKSGSRKSNR